MPPVDRQLDMIDSIYACALDPALWFSTLSTLRGNLKFHNASIDVFDVRTGGLMLSVASGIEEAKLRAHPNHGAHMVEQWGGAERVRRLPLDQPLLLSEVNARGLTPESPFFEQFDEPEGIIDVMTVRFARDAANITSLALGRHRDAGSVGVEEVELIRGLVPHVRRAVTISRMLKARAIRSATLEAVLDGLAVGVVLVDEEMRLVHANRAAERMLGAGGPLRLRSGKVCGAVAGTGDMYAAHQGP